MRQDKREDQAADEGRDHGDDGALGLCAGLVANQGHPWLGKEQGVPKRAQNPLNQGCNQDGPEVEEVQMEVVH